MQRTLKEWKYANRIQRGGWPFDKAQYRTENSSFKPTFGDLLAE